MDIGAPLDLTLRPDYEETGDVQARWRDLAKAARHPEESPTGASLGKWIATNTRSQELAYGILGVLRASLSDEADAELRADAAALIAAIPSELVVRVLKSEQSPAARRQLLEMAVTRLPLAGLPKLTLAAMEVHETTASPPLFGLLDRLRVLTATLPAEHAPKAESALRGAIRRALMLARADDLSALTQRFGDPDERVEPVRSAIPIEPARALAVGLATNAAGDVVWSALTELLDHDGDLTVLELLRHAEPGDAVDQVARRMATPRRLTWLLRREPFDVRGFDTLVRVMGSAAAASLVEELCESESRQVRRIVLDRLSGMGDRAASLAYSRLRDRRWFVVRNMLAVLRQCGGRVEVTQVEPLLAHEDARVRREAVLLLLGDAQGRTHALVAGLRDTDRNVLRAALQGARAGLPDAAIPVLAARLSDATFPPEQRVLALHLLGRSTNALALEALLKYASAGKTLMGGLKLAPKSAEMVAALAGLARTWKAERRAAALLQAAAKSGDAQIKEALAGRLEMPQGAA